MAHCLQTFWSFCPAVSHVPLRDATISNIVPFSLPIPTPSRAFVFPDGTAFFGDVKELVLAASAFVECDNQQYQIKSTGQQLVPGFEHSSFIAEMFAVLLVLNKFYIVSIYCDCQSLCDLMEAALDGHENFCSGSWMFSEMWRSIVGHIRQRPHYNTQGQGTL